MKWQHCTTEVEINGIIHDTVIKSFDSVITLNDILMTSPNCTTVVEMKKNIPDTIILWSHDQRQNQPHMTVKWNVNTYS